jgi:hypothetical protein
MTDSPIRVIDDFLPRDKFVEIADACMRSPLYTCMPMTAFTAEDDGSIETFGESDEMAKDKKMHECMMQQTLVVKFQNSQNVSDMWMYLSEQFRALTIQLNVKTLWMARVNVTMAASENFVGDFHVDLHNHPRRDFMQSAIYYFNTNNGGTKFEEGTFVQSKANRMVVFPMTMPHAGVWCTNRKLRYVMNINFEEN